MTLVTAVASQKGGPGKTTTSINLAAGLARKWRGARRVLLIDVDSQANASKVLIPDYARLAIEETVHQTIINQKALPIHSTQVAGLDMVPAHILLSTTDVDLTKAAKNDAAESLEKLASRLKHQLDRVKHRYEYVFIDCPPALGWLTLNAFTAADQVLVVVSPGYFELDSLVQIQKTIAETRRAFNADLTLRGFLFNMSDPTVNTANSLAILRKMPGDLLLKTIIPRNTDLRDAHFRKQDIFAFNPSAKGAVAFARLVEELYA